MKSRILYLLIFVSSYAFAQVPIDDIMRYTFRAGSIQNQANPGTNDLIQTNSGFNLISGWDNETDSALDNLDARFVAGSFPVSSNSQSANMSYSVWVNWTANENYRELFRKLNNNEQGASGGIYIHQQNGIISATISEIKCTSNPANACASAIRDAKVSTPVINDGNWHHIAVTYEESIANGYEQFEVKMYLDGVFIGSDTTDLLDTSWQTYMYNGNRTLEFCGNKVFGYRGKVDDVRVFDRTLTSSEAIALYNHSEPPLANQIYVNKEALGTGDGSSWVNAFSDLKTAMQANPLTPNFWVAKGTYTAGNSRTDSFTLTGDQKIYGGFDGTEVLLSERNLKANPTILSGDINGDDAVVFDPSDANRAENSYRILNVTGDNVVIDGFIITSANANGSASSNQEGSGVNIGGAYTVNINNCQFTKHTLSRAGVVRNQDNSGNVNLNINNTIFKDNQSVFATCYYGRSNGGANNLKFEGSLFVNNKATSSDNSAGSMIWLRQDIVGSQTLDVINTTFTNNTLTSGAPVVTYNGRVPTVEIHNSIFWNNTNGSGTIVDALQSGISGSLSNNISNNGFSSNGNALNILTTDPLFTDAANGDFTLQTGSPAINTGDNNKISAGITSDLLGNTRIYDTTVDMGAYEFNPSIPIDRILTTTAVNGSISADIQPTNGTYNDGAVVELTATPDAGYQFDGWSGDATGTVNPLSITMDADKSVTAIFSLPQQTLTTTAVNGTITADVQPTNGTYDKGTVVELTATPDAGYQFDGWSGDASGTTNPLSITLDADKSVEAIFTIIKETLTTTSTNGTITTDVAPTNGTYDYGTVVTLTATPDTGFVFSHWIGDTTETTSTITLTMDSSKTIEAVFECGVNIPDVNFKNALLSGTATKNNIDRGNVTIDTNNDGEISCAEAATFTGFITIGYKSISDLTGIEAFTNLFGLQCGNNNLTQVDLSNNLKLEILEIQNNNLTELDLSSNTSLGVIYCTLNKLISLNIANGLNISTQINILYGSTYYGFVSNFSGNQDLTCIQVSDVTYANANLASIKNTTTGFSEDCNAIVQQTLTTVASNGTVVADVQPTNGTYDNGTAIELTATPATGYQFDGWSGDATGTDNPLSITMDADKNITAMFSVDATASVVDNEFNNAIKIYPNPVQNNLHISLATGEDLKSIAVFNLLGKKVLETKSTTLNFGNFSTGIYVLKIENNKGKVAVRKIVKE